MTNVMFYSVEKYQTKLENHFFSKRLQTVYTDMYTKKGML
jgi:hypothetical protein